MRIIFRLPIHIRLAGEQLVNSRMLPKKKKKDKKREKIHHNLMTILSIPSTTHRCNI